MKPRVRWTGEKWQGIAQVKNLDSYKTPEQLAEEVSKIIIDNKLTEVVMVGESPGKKGTARCYRWMIGSTLLWYSELLRFHALHGYFPEE